MLKGSQILAYFSLRHDGDWDKIYDAVKIKERINEETVENALSKIKANYITILDPEYPSSLKQIYKPPFVLFYYGDISLINDIDKNLSVVGSRNASDYSLNGTTKIIKELNNAFNIVSGMALGVDTCAHQTMLNSNGKTIAVLGSGIDYPYPKRNTQLYDELCKNHLVISEYPNDLEPQKEYFPFRNRIILGLSWGVFIPEVKKQSGTMISVAHACNQNKDVMVMPQPIGNETYNNHLISEGACLIENGQDILNEKN